MDLGLVSYPHATREIKVIPWRQEEMVLATAPDHPLAKKAAAMRGPLPIEELNGVDFVGFDEELPIRSDVDRYFKEKGVELNVTVHFDNIQMIKEAVAHRVGVSIMPHRIMRDDIRQKRLTAIRLAGASHIDRWGLSIARPSDFSRWRRRSWIFCAKNRFRKLPSFAGHYSIAPICFKKRNVLGGVSSSNCVGRITLV